MAFKYRVGDKVRITSLPTSIEDGEVAHSDNGWFYCTNCGSGNTEIIED